jgi:hypothetical protein
MQLLYRFACICFLAPFALMMMTCTHLFAWLVDIVNIPLEMDKLLTSMQEETEEPEE